MNEFEKTDEMMDNELGEVSGGLLGSYARPPVVSPEDCCEHIEKKAWDGARCCANCVYSSNVAGMLECVRKF